MSLLSTQEIAQFLTAKDLDRRLIITPMLDPKRQIVGGAVDLRLGTDFYATKKTRLASVDPMDPDVVRQISEFHDRHHIPFGRSFVLHPQEFILASSLEYLCFPTNLAGRVSVRSSGTRLGVSFAGGPLIRPTYKGTLTLELLNSGSLPVVLRPGMRIVQLSIHVVERESTELQAKYKYSTGPEPSKLYDDTDLAFLTPPPRQVVIGLTGPMAAGKTEVVMYLHRRKRFVPLSLAHFVAQEADKEGLPPTRENLCSVGNDRRKANSAIFAKCFLASLPREQVAPLIVVNSIVNPAEAELLKANCRFFFLGVTADPKVRFERILIARRDEPFESEEEFLASDRRDMGEGQPEYGQHIEECLRMARKAEAQGWGGVIDTSDIPFGQYLELYRRVDRFLEEVAASVEFPLRL